MPARGSSARFKPDPYNWAHDFLTRCFPTVSRDAERSEFFIREDALHSAARLTVAQERTT